MRDQATVRATYMRGGTSKGVFFNRADLPLKAQQAGPERDALLLRVIGSPDPYGKHTDGMGGATSSTSKAVILSTSQRAGFDVDYEFGQVAIDRPFVDWSGNCGNLTAAVGAFAIENGLVAASRVPQNGQAEVRIWQVNTQKAIIARIPIKAGSVQELGEFQLDGVTFPAAEIAIEFVDPAGDGALFPSGNLVDELIVPGEARLPVTMINAGIPTLFFNASSLGFSGSETQADINTDLALLERLEHIRAHGALAMGLIDDIEAAKTRQHTPKLAWVSAPQAYAASSGKAIAETDIDLCVRAMSMGQLHHAMMGTAAVAIAVASVIPGTLVQQASGHAPNESVNFGHPSGTLKVGATVQSEAGQWVAKSVTMSRSARVLMEGYVRIPAALT